MFLFFIFEMYIYFIVEEKLFIATMQFLILADYKVREKIA